MPIPAMVGVANRAWAAVRGAQALNAAAAVVADTKAAAGAKGVAAIDDKSKGSAHLRSPFAAGRPDFAAWRDPLKPGASRQRVGRFFMAQENWH